jgi:phosphoribosylaminoimidazolecarboxamide formyltransferase/IMP cyclohydrolase
MRALLSVYDKSGLVEFASRLNALGYELVSTGGTARVLSEAGLGVTTVDSVTGFPEILDGRVKTLHPNIHGGLLARTDLPSHMESLQEHQISPIDVVVCNLYPFEAAVSDESLSEQDKIEQIDIGGPAMVRAAAKNHSSVVVVTNPADYDAIANALERGDLNQEVRRNLAAKAFGHVSTYDSLVAEFLRGPEDHFPQELAIGLRLKRTPRYGENSHQRAGAYTRLRAGNPEPGLLQAELLKGDDLSFNNYLDADSAWQASQVFDGPTVAIVKHTVPCGLAVRPTLAEAYQAAFEGDEVSAFGGIVSLNQPVDMSTAQLMRKIKLDIILAPEYDDDVLELLNRKKGTRILRLPNWQQPRRVDPDVRPIVGGLLVQEPDVVVETAKDWRQVTRASASKQEIRDLEFAWKVTPLVKSNAIVFVKDEAIVGLGAGQPNRLESVNLATRKAGDRSRGAVMASDAFFPFADGIQLAIDAGVSAVVQPGGSLRDDEVIEAANAAGITMYFTGRRHFHH